MSTLTLIRHGQAAAFQPDSDRLTALGEQQAQALARFWLASGITFDQVFTGVLERQRRTESIVAREFHLAGVPWPEAQATVGWNEYDAHGVLTRFVPALAARDERFRELLARFEAARGGPEQNRHFQRMFEIAMALWMEGAAGPEGVEPFHTFQARVIASLKALTAEPRSRRVAVFTSGGPTGLLVQHVLQAPPRAFLDVNWRVRNGALTEFIFSGDRISLDSFNDTGYLAPAQRSYR